MELSAVAQAWVHLILVWVGFGALVGLVANLFLPPNGSPGLWGGLIVGITGSCVGPGLLTLLIGREHFNPIGPAGFCVAVLVAVMLLLLYRGYKFLGKPPKETFVFAPPLPPCEHVKKFTNKKSES